MKGNDNLTDPRRTIPAGKTVDGLVHRIYLPPQGGKVLYSVCGIEMPEGSQLAILQRPEDITCPACADSRVSKEEIEQLLKSQPKVFAILPLAPDCCQVCGVKHEPGDPHDKQSLFYQMKFYRDYGHWPTWEDAMKHCPEEIKAEWRTMLRFFNEKVD